MNSCMAALDSEAAARRAAECFVPWLDCRIADASSDEFSPQSSAHCWGSFRGTLLIRNDWRREQIQPRGERHAPCRGRPFGCQQ